MKNEQREALIAVAQHSIRRWGPIPGRMYDLSDAAIESMYQEALESDGRSMMLYSRLVSQNVSETITRRMLQTERPVYETWLRVITRFHARAQAMPQRMQKLADEIHGNLLPCPPAGRRRRGIGVPDYAGRLSATVAVVVVRAWARFLGLNLPLESSRASPDSLASLVCIALERQEIETTESNVARAFSEHWPNEFASLLDALVDRGTYEDLMELLPEPERGLDRLLNAS